MQIQDFLNSVAAHKTRTAAGVGADGGFNDQLAGAESGGAEQTRWAAGTAGGVPIDNPLASDWWPDRFEARMDYAAEKLGTNVAEVKAQFADLADRAMAADGYVDPKSFLKSLEEEDRVLLQRVQGLADPISDARIDNLSHEGAMNMLLPPGAQRDFNADGFHEIGEAFTFRMPPDSAPQEFKDAWADLTDGMSMEDLMMAEARFMPMMVSANIKYDGAGTPVGIYGPRDPEYRNPFTASDFSYRQLAQDRLDFLKESRGMVGEDQYQRDHTFWTRYLEKMDKFGVEAPGRSSASAA